MSGQGGFSLRSCTSKSKAKENKRKAAGHSKAKGRARKVKGEDGSSMSSVAAAAEKEVNSAGAGLSRVADRRAEAAVPAKEKKDDPDFEEVYAQCKEEYATFIREEILLDSLN